MVKQQKSGTLLIPLDILQQAPITIVQDHLPSYFPATFIQENI